MASLYRWHDSPGIVGAIHRDWQTCFPSLKGLIEEVARNPGLIVRDGKGEGVTSYRDIGGRAVYAKIYKPGRMTRTLRDLVGNPRSIREWNCNVAAADAGIVVSTVVLALTERYGWRFRHLVVTEPVPGIAISDILDEEVASPVELGKLLRLMGAELARYHDRGFFHRHLKATHLFLQPDRTFTCIDLEGSIVKRPLPLRMRRENLGQIRRSLERYPITKGRFPELLAAYEKAWIQRQKAARTVQPELPAALDGLKRADGGKLSDTPDSSAD